MKKTLFLFAGLMAVICLTFTGCSKDDNNDPTITGTWDQTLLVYKSWTNDEEPTPRTTNLSEGSVTVEFKADKTFKISTSADAEVEMGMQPGTGTYSLEGNKIIIKYDDEEEADSGEFSFSDNNTLIIKIATENAIEDGTWHLEITSTFKKK